MVGMSDEPVEFAEVLDGWAPAPEVVHGALDPWPAAALAALLGRPAPGPGEPLPPLWQEVYLRAAHAVSELADDGHPGAGSLVPPLRDRRRMFGGGRITVHRPLLVGEPATRTSSVAGVRARQGRSGWLLLVTEQHEVCVDGAVRVREERDIVYRRAADVGRTAAAAAAPAPADPPDYTIEPDERLLFCMSALTYNAHRIHYDRDFTVGVEGHPDLLVHGPLLALGAVETVRRQDPREIARMQYRLVSPAYLGRGTIGFACTRDDSGSLRVVGSQDAVPTVEATFTMR